MRGHHRSLRELIAELRLSPEERLDARAEECMEALFDPARCSCSRLGEREEAAVEAERRRREHAQPSNSSTTLSSTGL
jgi:hypothetical protein